jgi:hypothetical protein
MPRVATRVKKYTALFGYTPLLVTTQILCLSLTKFMAVSCVVDLVPRTRGPLRRECAVNTPCKKPHQPLARYHAPLPVPQNRHGTLSRLLGFCLHLPWEGPALRHDVPGNHPRVQAPINP